MIKKMHGRNSDEYAALITIPSQIQIQKMKVAPMKVCIVFQNVFEPTWLLGTLFGEYLFRFNFIVPRSFVLRTTKK